MKMNFSMINFWGFRQFVKGDSKADYAIDGNVFLPTDTGGSRADWTKPLGFHDLAALSVDTHRRLDPEDWGPPHGSDRDYYKRVDDLIRYAEALYEYLCAIQTLSNIATERDGGFPDFHDRRQYGLGPLTIGREFASFPRPKMETKTTDSKEEVLDDLFA